MTDRRAFLLQACAACIAGASMGFASAAAKGLLARTSDLVQRLQVACRELALEAAIDRLDRLSRYSRCLKVPASGLGGEYSAERALHKAEVQTDPIYDLRSKLWPLER